MPFLSKIFFCVCFIALCGAFFETNANPITIRSGSYTYNYQIVGVTSIGSVNYNLNGRGLSVQASSPSDTYFGPVRGSLTLEGVSSNVLYDFSNSSFNTIFANPNIPRGLGTFSAQQLQDIGAMVDANGIYRINSNFTMTGTLSAATQFGTNTVYTTQIYGFGIANFAYAPLIVNGNTVGYYLTNYSLNFQPTASQPVPEPIAILLFGTGLAGIGYITSRRKKKNKD